MAGTANAVGSYRPAGEPEALPPRHLQDRTIYAVGDVIGCQRCNRTVYEVVEEIRGSTLLSTIPAKLAPAAPEVAPLTGETRIKREGGTAMDCPLCLAEWGVVLL